LLSEACHMNDYQAKSGFKTFIVTLGVSLLLFGVLYYVLSGTSVTPDIESDTSLQGRNNSDTLAAAQVSDAQSEKSVFSEISKKKPEVPVRTVLAGATEATESTVPLTGTTSITISLVLSLSVLAVGAYVYAKNPHKFALAHFEKEVTEEI